MRTPFRAYTSATAAAASALSSRTMPTICCAAILVSNSLRPIGAILIQATGAKLLGLPGGNPNGPDQQGDQRGNRQTRLLRPRSVREDHQSREDLREPEAGEQGK